MYRVASGDASKPGAWWTFEPPETVSYVIGGTAVRPEWNSFSNMYVYEVPAGKVLNVWSGSAGVR